MNRWTGFACGFPLAAVFLLYHSIAIGDGDIPSEFSNRGSIVNTRHNLTQRGAETVSGKTINAQIMDIYRNNYGEVCVYCHTPHGASATSGAPLWNRTLPAGSAFTTYSTLNSATLTQTVTAPGANSLICLSCHDGQTAIDSIMNMPGSQRYSSSPNQAFLNSWDPDNTFTHSRLGDELLHTGDASNITCMGCHQPEANNGSPGATDFSVFVIGRNLTNDHPVGITFPTANADFNAPAGTQGGAKFFDLNGNNRMDKNEVRVYDTGDGHEVECASCHDPHGVPSGGAGSNFIPTFMRVANSGGGVNSGLCLTCHVK